MNYVKHLLPATVLRVFARLWPKSFPFRSLPPEIQLSIFRLFIGTSPPEDSPKDLAIRHHTRQNLLLVNKSTYQDLAPELYKNVVFRFLQPHLSIDSFLVDTCIANLSKLCQQNIRYLDWHLGVMAGKGVHWSKCVQVESIEASTKELLSRVPALSEFRLVFKVGQSHWRSQFQGVFPATCDAWADWLDHNSDGYLAKVKSILDTSFPTMLTTRHVVVRYSGGLSRLWTDQRITSGVKVVKIVSVGFSILRI